MKKIEIYIAKNYFKLFFEKRIKTKIEILILLLEFTKIFLISENLEKTNNSILSIIYVDKMSRVFFFSENKYFSINFPFGIKNNKLYFYSIEIDNKIISDLLSFIKEFYGGNTKTSENFIDFIWEKEKNYEGNDFFELLKGLLLMEDGYIRYDLDEEREKGALHPKNHYDIFYENNNTLKIGLKGNLTPENFIDFINVNSNCKFLS